MCIPLLLHFFSILCVLSVQCIHCKLHSLLLVFLCHSLSFRLSSSSSSSPIGLFSDFSTYPFTLDYLLRGLENVGIGGMKHAVRYGVEILADWGDGEGSKRLFIF